MGKLSPQGLHVWGGVLKAGLVQKPVSRCQSINHQIKPRQGKTPSTNTGRTKAAFLGWDSDNKMRQTEEEGEKESVKAGFN